MSKGLKALEKIDHTICMNNLENNIKWDIDKYDHCACVNIEDFVECYEIIEKELKQAEENEKLLNIFKNALTIEHHDYPMVELDHNEDSVNYFVKQFYTIKQNELDKSMREALREWVLKNAFPKELKAFDIIRKYFWLEDFQDFIAFNGRLPKCLKEECDALKEVKLCR